MQNVARPSYPTGGHFYGRPLLCVEIPAFGARVGSPLQSWDRSKLVIFREDKKRSPDRLPENGPPGQRYGFDQNHEYRLEGYFTGREAYDPNSNQFLPEFMLTGYETVSRNPGWLFRPDDSYDPHRITLYSR